MDLLPSHFRLTYFNHRGRAEVIRWLLALGDVQYDDHRIDLGDVPKQNPLVVPQDCDIEMPFNQLPTLEIDGKIFCQTKAICRYLASLYGLLGETAMDRLYADMVVECVDDLVNKIIMMRREKCEKRQAEILDGIRNDVLPRDIANLDRLVKNKPHDGSYILGEKITWADLYFTAFIVNVEQYMNNFHGFGFGTEQYPRISSLLAKVQRHPRIAAWIQRRPITAR